MRFGKNAIIVLSIGGGMSLWTAGARTQSTRSALEAPPAFHREQPDDPPGKAAKDNPNARSPAGRAQRGPYVSIQVNVDEFGNNIVGDAANEPSIAIDPNDPDKIAIGWRQFDTIDSNFRQAGWGYSQDGGQSWTFPGVLEPGQFRSDPVLASDADGNFYYSSLSAVDSAQVFKSTNGGVTWPTMVDAFGGDKQWIAVDRTSGIGSGHVYQIWNVQSSCCPPNDFTWSTNGGASFESPIQVGPPSMKWGTMDVGPDGTLYLAGATLSQGGHRFTKSTNAQDPMQTPIFAPVHSIDLGGVTRFGGSPNPGGLLGQVWIATDHSGGQKQDNVYVLGSVDPPGEDPLDVMFIRSTDGGQTWSSPLRVNDDPPGTNAWQWFGTMSVAPTGRIDVFWNDTRSYGGANHSELFYSFSTDAGLTWAANIPVSPQFNSIIGWPSQAKIGDYYDMISDTATANLAYAATFNGEQDVYFLRLGDCNDNDIHDGMDIANGTSDDCNDNQFPDDCEPDEDCNANGIQDICDIADGTSNDCNGNGIPDECIESEEDCNANQWPDACDIADGTSNDCNGNGIPDECIDSEEDCNANQWPDACDIADGTSNDCNGNGIPDECDIADGTSEDCTGNGVPHECELFNNQVLHGAGDRPVSVAVGDLVGDLDLDLAVANFGSGDVSVLLNNGDGTFAPRALYGAGDGPSSVAVGDLDGDGDIDLAVANFQSDNVSVLLNNGDGTFAPHVLYDAGDGPRSLAVGDLDGDLDLDLAVANLNSNDVSVLLNNGDGSFAPQALYGAGDGPNSVAVGDLDGDLDFDLAVANVFGDNVSVLLNKRGGTFAPHVLYSVGHSPRSVAVGDLDGDSDLDLAVAKTTGDNVAVLLNNGNGTFAPRVLYDAGDGSRSVAVGDLDGDLDLDLAVANFGSGDVSVLLNNGGGIFAPQALYGAGDGPISVVVGDLDGNSNLDLAVANWDSDNFSVLLNICETRFIPLFLDIKSGSCPNPFSRHGNGVLPVALVGTVEFNPTEVDLSTLQLSREDGVGGSVGPNEGPPGPHSGFEDVATPFEGEACECHDLGGDGIDDLSMKFRTDEMVEALELDALPGGAVVELVLSGSLLDGTPFLASDCIVILPPGDTAPANAHVESSVADTFVEVAPLDLNFDTDGFADFSRSYYSGTAMTLTAPPQSAGRRFVRWLVDGAPRPIGMRTIEVIVSEDTTLKAAYARPARPTPVHPTELDDPLE